MAVTYSHHLIGYHPGPPVGRPQNPPDIQELISLAVYHLTEHLRTTQNGHGQTDIQDPENEIPLHLVRYKELQELLAGARRLASSSKTAILLDSPAMLRQ